MKYKIGRDNFALTIFIPVNCSNNCEFCTSKQDYTSNPPSLEAVKSSIEKVARYKIPFKEIVITGGEPFADLEVLDEIIKLVNCKFDLPVYINTTLPRRTMIESVKYINKTSAIAGVNISRHIKYSFAEHIAPTEFLSFITKPTHINCVISGTETEDEIREFCKTYEPELKPTDNIVFRADYRQITQDGLRAFSDTDFQKFEDIFGYRGSTGCNVCNTDSFGYAGKIRYHRGLENSALHFKRRVEVNDMIIKQNGEIRYDWNESFTATDDILKRLVADNKTASPKTERISCPMITSSCGVMRCGG